MSPPKRRPDFVLPISVSTAKVVENARRGGAINFAALTKIDASVPNDPRRKAEQDAREASYRVEDPTPTAVDLRRPDLPGFMMLESTSIAKYDHNPRVFANEERSSIRASLLAHGFQGAFVVTRRRQGEPYILAKGSNTTLELVQELYRETQDERFRYVTCVYQDFKDDRKVLAQHLAENLNRGDMKFWEQAMGMLELASQIEAHEIAEGLRSKPMTIREVAEALTKEGLRAERTGVNTWQFAKAHLGALGTATSLLKHRHVRDTLKPRLLELARLADLLGIPEEAFWKGVVTPVLQGTGQRVMSEDQPELDVGLIVDEVTVELAARCSETVVALRAMLQCLNLRPTASLAELRAPSPSILVGQMPSGADNSDLSFEEETPDARDMQRPLAIGPGLVKPSVTSLTLRSASTSQQQESRAAPTNARPDKTDSAQQQLLSPQPLSVHFKTEEAPAEALPRFKAALHQLALTAGIEDTLRFHAAMPLGYYVELPDPARHGRVAVTLGSADEHFRRAKSLVWWTLSNLSAQWTSAVAEVIDTNSVFYQRYSSDGGSDPFEGLDIESHEPEPAAALMTRLRPGAQARLIAELRQIEALAAEVLAHHPDRWSLMERLRASDSPY